MTKKNKKDKDNEEDAECKGESCPINGPANGGHDDNNEYTDELLASVTGEDQPKLLELPKLRDLVPKKLLMRDRCLQLGYMIGPLTQKQDKRSLEVGGFFLVKKDDDSFAFQDFIIPKELPVSEGSIYVAEHYDQTAREVKTLNQKNNTSLRFGAMFHVHPYKAGGLYHSNADDKALESLLNKLAKTTRKVHESPYMLIQDKLRKEYGDKAFCLKGDELSDAVQRFIYPDDILFFKVLREFGLKPDPAHFKKKDFMGRLLDMIGKETYEPRLVNFAVSFVFNNNKGGHYVKLGAQEKFVFTGKESSIYIENLPLEIFDEGVDIPTEEEVTELIKERIVFPEKIKTKWISRAASKIVYSGPSGSAVGSIGVSSKKSVAERIASLVEPAAAAESSEGNVSGDDALESIVTGEDVVSSAPKKTEMPANQIAKTKDRTYNNEEIAELFVLAANSYLADFRHAECKYSTYMVEILDLLGKYRYTYYAGSAPGYDTRVKNTNLPGIRTSVEQTGSLVEDNPRVVETHFTHFYRIQDSIDNIIDEILELQDSESAKFMLEFVFAKDIDEKNKLLETYVTGVLTAKVERYIASNLADGKSTAGHTDNDKDADASEAGKPGDANSTLDIKSKDGEPDTPADSEPSSPGASADSHPDASEDDDMLKHTFRPRDRFFEE